MVHPIRHLFSIIKTSARKSLVEEGVTVTTVPSPLATAGFTSAAAIIIGLSQLKHLADLTQVRGIGVVLSERIIKYRTRLQGFDELNQLYEVYGLDSLVVENVKRQFKIKTKPKRTKIPVAVVSLEALLRIPYLSKSEAKKIIGLRTRNQNLTLKNLRSEPGFDSLKIERLALYLH